MDELFRLTPAERRKRHIMRLAITGLVVLVAIIITGIIFGRRALEKSNRPIPPSAYLVALAPDTAVRIAGKNALINNTLAIPEGTSIEIPDGTRTGLVYPKNGFIEKITGPATLRPEAFTPNGDDTHFLASPREALITALYPGPRESTGRVLVTSPFGVTRFTNPIITWEPRPGTRYDVAVIDPADPDTPPRIAVNVLPPVRVDQLETPLERILTTDRIYNVIVREAGSETQVGGMRFLVAPDATAATLPRAPAELVAEALDALRAVPSRTGDGWLALSRLPPDWAESELVLRLRMRAAAELGLFDEIEKIQQHLAALKIKK